MHVSETDDNVRSGKREHVDAVETFNTKKSALSQHVIAFEYNIGRDNVKTLKSESSFLVKSKGSFTKYNQS